MRVGSRKTLKTGPKDRIFIYFADHGGPGMSQFGNTTHNILYATNLTDTFTKMNQEKKYSEMVLYWESCYSGSMFLHLPNNINVYALSASNATQSSWACYCNPNLDNNPRYFGDCFSIHWMEDADDKNLRNETLLIQFWITRHETNMNNAYNDQISHVEQWGSVSEMNQESVADYLGSKNTKVSYNSVEKFKSNALQYFPIPQPDVPLKLLEMKYENTKTPEERHKTLQIIQSLKYKRKLLNSKIKQITQTAVDISVETNNIDFKIKDNFINGSNSNITLNREQYENCFYPVVLKFQDKCFSMTCNDYVIYQTKAFLPLCKAKIELNVLEMAIDIQCKHQKRICGIH